MYATFVHIERTILNSKTSIIIDDRHNVLKSDTTKDQDVFQEEHLVNLPADWGNGQWCDPPRQGLE